MEKIKFLMTDTGAQITPLCRQALEAKGVQVTVCEKNGAKALRALLEEHPQAALLDAFMPDLDAITVKQRYEAQDTSGARTTFFVTGAFQSEEIEQELLDNGFSFFFVKPFDETVLVSRVLKAAGGPARPQPLSQDSDELTVTEILHQVGVPRAHQGLPVPARRHPARRRRPRVHQRRHQAPVPGDRQAQQHHRLPRRARHPPCDRSRLGPRRRRYAQQLFRLHHPQHARQTDQFGVHRHDRRQDPPGQAPPRLNPSVCPPGPRPFPPRAPALLIKAGAFCCRGAAPDFTITLPKHDARLVDGASCGLLS